MKGISKIEIKHFKGLYGTYNLDLGENCKNLLLYGENGSGKSSICNALKLFFEASSDSTKKFKPSEHKFLIPAETNTGYIQLTFVKDDGTEDSPVNLLCDDSNRPTQSYVKETNKLKAFLGYKDLLETHHVKADNVNVFLLLIKNILYFFPNAFNKKILGEEWQEVLDLFKSYQSDRRKFQPSLIKALETFNDGVKNAISEVIAKANELIKKFKYNIEINLAFEGVELSTTKGTLEKKEIYLKVHYHGSKNLPRHHFFLNEARLTAIGISIFLAAVLKIPTLGKYKILVLDDIFVGLDTANRIPLLEIFEKFFDDYQIVMATYDRHWYSVARKWLSNKPTEWKSYELYLDDESYKYGKTELVEGYSPLAKAISHYRSPKSDYPASANYMRKAAENAIKNFLPKHFLKNDEGLNYVNLNSFILKAIEFCKLSERDYSKFLELQAYKDMLLNPMSHYNIEYPVYRSDLIASKKLIEWIETLPRSYDCEFKKLLDVNSKIRFTIETRKDDRIKQFAYKGETSSELFFIRNRSSRKFIGKINITQTFDFSNPNDLKSFNKEMYYKALSKSIIDFATTSGYNVTKSHYQYFENDTWKDMKSIPDDFWDKLVLSKKLEEQEK